MRCPLPQPATVPEARIKTKEDSSGIIISSEQVASVLYCTQQRETLKITNLKLNKPIYVGMNILHLNKTLMYDFHYEYIRTKYDHADLLFTNTDSLCYHIRRDDIYKDM